MRRALPAVAARRTTMTRRLFSVALFALGAAVVASCWARASHPFPGDARYELTRGSSISITTDTGGASTIVVTIPPGSPGAGEYVSTAEALVEPAREAKNGLDDPRRITLIDVDAAGRLTAVEQTGSK
jgi:hypothetical protein